LDVYFGTKKIKMYNRDDYQALYRYITHLCKLHGISEAPDKEILMEVVNFLKQNFSDFSKEEIERAFSYAYAGVTNCEDTNNYNKLTPSWFGRILFAYRTLREKELIEYTKTQTKLAMKEREDEVTPEVINNEMALFTIKAFVSYKKDGGTVNDFGNSIYRFLLNNRIVNFPEDVMDELRVEAKEILIKRTFNKNSEDVFNRVLSSMKDEAIDSATEREAKTLAVMSFFDLIIEKELEMNEVLCKFLTK
jgi:hypothetical protein